MLLLPNVAVIIVAIIGAGLPSLLLLIFLLIVLIQVVTVLTTFIACHWLILLDELVLPVGAATLQLQRLFLIFAAA